MRLLALVACALLLAGCFRADPPVVTTPVATTPAATTPVATTPAPAFEPRFDGARALQHVRAQVEDEHGAPRYRVPGSIGNDEVARLIDATMAGLGFDVTWHHFNASYGCQTVAMHNVVAQRDGTSGKVVVFAAHYDTRPVADKDPDATQRGEPILGANDGASGVAVLLELARVLPETDDTVRFLFFDGEDGGGDWAGCRTEWILGSRAYAESLSVDDVASIRALVLVDMVGDPQLLLPREGYSLRGPGARVQEEVYDAAAKLGHEQFLDEQGHSILDDHVPFLERMVPAVDLIHTIPGDPQVFPAWHHTHADDMDAVSADSLAAVGETLEAWLAGR